jgi:DDE superfamily endonuclease/Helix-turn-helix of DDE superfamily endonuclease
MGSMIMRYRTLSQYPAIFLKMTGLRLGEFDQMVADLLPVFVEGERRRLERSDRKRAIGGGRHSALDERDQLLLTVVWLRQYPTHALLGYLFGVHPPTVGRYLERVLPLLEQAGRDTMRMPDPGRKRRRKLDALLADTPELAVVIDSFEQKIQRPKDKAKRDSYYSGKKKTHTLKSQVAVDEETGAIADVSDSVPGPTADLKLLEQSNLLERLPQGVGGLGDSAYQGIAKLHPLCASPRKKPWGKNKPRPPEDILYNHAFSCRRIVVENTINRLRRYQCLTQTDRQHRQNHTLRVCAVAGLVNRQLAHRLAA